MGTVHQHVWGHKCGSGSAGRFPVPVLHGVQPDGSWVCVTQRLARGWWVHRDEAPSQGSTAGGCRPGATSPCQGPRCPSAQGASEPMAEAAVPFIIAAGVTLSFLSYTMAQAVTMVHSGSRRGTRTSHLPLNGAVAKSILVRPCGMRYVWMQPPLENLSAILSITNTHRDISITARLVVTKQWLKCSSKRARLTVRRFRGKRPHLQ